MRDARPDELDEVSAVLSAAYAEYARPAPAWEEYARDVADVRSRLADADLIVAERDGRVLGAVTFYPDGTRSEGAGWPPGWAGVRLLGVLPEARGRGIGRALTDECVRRARDRGAVAVGLHTTVLMEVARGMYERMGFVRAPEFDFRPAAGIVVMGYRLDL